MILHFPLLGGAQGWVNLPKRGEVGQIQGGKLRLVFTPALA
ncbi:MAG: hypothetical protein OT643_14755 [Bacteroidetes bacterium]|nr:hypothetical protein [Bacteroidota bacterium]